ncbi:hypothetical protein ACOSP7_031973 [Xanthoceras sorbifolium]
MAASGSSSNLNAANSSSIVNQHNASFSFALQMLLQVLLSQIMHEGETINITEVEKEEAEEMEEEEESFVNCVAKQAITRLYVTTD